MKVSVFDELNELLPKKCRFKEFEIKFRGRQSIKHIIESLGIPHTEIGMLANNEQPIDFSYLVQHEDHVAVHPATANNDNYSGMFDDGRLVVEPHFILDNHLGKLATYLRILGFDAIYRNDFQDDELAELSSEEIRILLTRDRGLLKRKIVTRGYLVRENDPKEQIREIVRRFDLSQLAVPYSRCSLCNGLLSSVSKKAIEKDLEILTKEHYHHFKQCSDCHQIYWKGSHFNEMEVFIHSIVKNKQETSI